MLFYFIQEPDSKFVVTTARCIDNVGGSVDKVNTLHLQCSVRVPFLCCLITFWLALSQHFHCHLLAFRISAPHRVMGQPSVVDAMCPNVNDLGFDTHHTLNRYSFAQSNRQLVLITSRS